MPETVLRRNSVYGFSKSGSIHSPGLRLTAALCAATAIRTGVAFAETEATSGLQGFIKDNYLEILGILPALCLLLLLAFIIHLDSYIRTAQKKSLRVIIIVLFSLVAQNYAEYRHCVRIRDKGIVRVNAVRREYGHVITVWYNGIGFDVAEIDTADSSHIGLRNVRERIEGMCGGSMKVESSMGEGTTVTIIIPPKESKSGGWPAQPTAAGSC